MAWSGGQFLWHVFHLLPLSYRHPCGGQHLWRSQGKFGSESSNVYSNMMYHKPYLCVIKAIKSLYCIHKTSNRNPMLLYPVVQCWLFFGPLYPTSLSQLLLVSIINYISQTRVLLSTDYLLISELMCSAL